MIVVVIIVVVVGIISTAQSTGTVCALAGAHTAHNMHK